MEANRKEREMGGGEWMMISRHIAVRDTYVRGSQTQRKDPPRSSMRTGSQSLRLDSGFRRLRVGSGASVF